MSLSVLEFRPRRLSLGNDENVEDEISFLPLNQDLPRYIENSFTSTPRLQRNLRYIARQLEECTDLMQSFLKAFEEWKLYRKRSIKCLQEIITELDKIHFSSNIAKTTASVGAVLSGCLGIAGAVTTVSGGNGSSLRLASGVGNLVSCVVSSGTAATERGLSKVCLDKARLILQNDSDQFVVMQEWFERSQDLKSAIEEVCNCDIISDFFQTLMVVGPQVMSTCESFVSQVDGVVNQVVKHFRKNISHNDIEQIILLCASICHNPELFKVVNNICQMIRGAPSIMPVVTSLVKVPYELKSLGRYISSRSLKFTNPAGSRKESRSQSITYGIFQGVNIAIELFALSQLVEDFKKGSTSEQSAALREVTKQLEMELDLVSSVHENLAKK